MERFNFDVQIRDVEKVNPLFSKCKIYICYSDLNRNNSDIDKNVINEAIYSLYGCPIVGEFNKSKDDFLDHGGTVELDENGDYQYVTTTIPYGFINESSEVKWEFIDGKDYLTATGYLWTSRYPESLKAIEEGRPQSMEIDQVEGKFNNKKNFVVSSFVFSGLCILGNDVEACFEEAKITAYTLNKDDFKKEFNLMVQELKESLQIDEVNNSDDINTEPIVDNQMFNKNNNAKEGDVMPLSKKEIATKFSLTASQLFDEFSRVLGEVTYEGEDYWGDTVEMSRFYLRDYDDSFVYVVDCANDRMDMKIPYSKDGDNLNLNYESASRIKYTPTDWIGGTEDDSDYDNDVTIDVVQDFAKKIVSEAKERIAKIEANFSTEKETFSVELSKRDVAISEKEEAIISFNEKLQAFEQELSAKDEVIASKIAEIETLSQFKLEIEQTERKEKVESLFTKFAHVFSKDEIDSLREKEVTFAKLDDFEKEIKSLACDKLITANKETSTFSRMAIDTNIEEINSTEPTNVFDRLSKKNKKQ